MAFHCHALLPRSKHRPGETRAEKARLWVGPCCSNRGALSYLVDGDDLAVVVEPVRLGAKDLHLRRVESGAERKIASQLLPPRLTRRASTRRKGALPAVNPTASRPLPKTVSPRRGERHDRTERRHDGSGHGASSVIAARPQTLSVPPFATKPPPVFFLNNDSR